MAEEKTTTLTTGKARLSYANLTVARAMEEGGKEQYGTVFLIPKSDKKTIALIGDAEKAAIAIGITKGKFTAADVKGVKFKSPLRDGDEEKPGDPNYADHYFINAKSDTRPSVVGRNMQKILDPEEIYSGMYALGSITLFPFGGKETKGNKGIGASLNTVMKLADGDRLSGGVSAEQAFSGIDLSEFDSEDYGTGSDEAAEDEFL